MTHSGSAFRPRVPASPCPRVFPFRIRPCPRPRVGFAPILAVIAVALLSLVISACGGRPSYPPVTPPAAPVGKLGLLGYTIQVGAFAQVENAARLAAKLQWAGLDAYYFVDEDRLYKVRFGDFATKEAARQQAEALKTAGTIEVYYITTPEQYSSAQRQRLGESYMRDQLIKTARGFIGVPYLWGGESAEDGFDCSGLTMTTYRLNGLNLPRNSRQQFAAGVPVAKNQLTKGDLVFFATKKKGIVSHVGMYIGEGRFIHAPKSGQTVRIENLAEALYQKTYMGGRSYL